MICMSKQKTTTIRVLEQTAEQLALVALTEKITVAKLVEELLQVTLDRRYKAAIKKLSKSAGQDE